MNRHARIKIPLPRPHLHRHPKPLEHLRAATPQNMQPHHLLLLARADQFIRRRRLRLRRHHGIIHGREIRLVDLDVAVAEPVARFLLRQADGADFRVGEHHRGDVGVVQFRVLMLRPAEEAVGQLAARGDGDRGEFDFAADVAEGVDVVDVGVLVVVGDDLALLILVHAGFVEAEVFDFRVAADGPEEAVDVEGGAVGGGFVRVVHRHPSVVFFDDLGLRAVAVDVDALAFVFFDDGLLDHGVEGAEEGFVADEEVRFAPEVVEHPGHFDGDVACTHQGDAFGESFKVEESVGGDTEFGARGVGDVGMAPGGKEDFFGADGFFGAAVEDDFDFVFGKQVGAAMEVLDVVFFEVSFVYTVQTFDVVISFVLKGRKVERAGFFDIEPIRCRLVKGFGNSSGVPGDLLGHTAGMLSVMRL